MKNVILLDTETTGLEPTENGPIEVAVVLFSVEHACALASFATLIQSPRENAAVKINRIPQAALAEGMPAERAWQTVANMAKRAEAFVAHRAEFDMSFTPEPVRSALPWICSKFDLAWPDCEKVGDGLVHIALAHGLGVSHAHRAMSDVDTLSRLLVRLHERGYDLGKFLAYGLRPKAKFQALVSYDDKQLAKDASFQWEDPPKRWVRVMARDDVASLPFPTREVQT